MGVRRQPRHQLADELLTGRIRRELVEVVDEDADVERGDRCERPENTIEAAAALRVDTEGGQDRP